MGAGENASFLFAIFLSAPGAASLLLERLDNRLLILDGHVVVAAWADHNCRRRLYRFMIHNQ